MKVSVPLPAGAESAGEFDNVFNDRQKHRWIYGTSRAVGGIVLAIGGFQAESGQVRSRVAYIVPNPRNNELDPAGLRQLARAAIATADELERLSDADAKITL
jgi:hypothetical protein